MIMTAAQYPAWAKGLSPEQISFYEHLSLAATRCRGSGRHLWNLTDLVMLAGNNPKGVELIPLADGTVEVRDWCQRDCGRFQSYVTNDEGEILWDTRDYGTGPGTRYLAKGLDLTRADDRRYLQHCTQAMISRAIARRLKIARKAQLQAVS